MLRSIYSYAIHSTCPNHLGLSFTSRTIEMRCPSDLLILDPIHPKWTSIFSSVTSSHASCLLLSLDPTLSLSHSCLVHISFPFCRYSSPLSLFSNCSSMLAPTSLPLCQTVFTGLLTLNTSNLSSPSVLCVTSSFHLNLMPTNLHCHALTNLHSSAFQEGSPPL